MTDKNNCNKDVVLIAIDIAKNVHDVLIEWPHGNYKQIRLSTTVSERSRRPLNS